MPIKNAALYLEQCLDSIIAQGMESWELIAINDHSTDNTNMILESYARLDKRITHSQNDGNGIIDALQKGYSLSSGVYITRMDADDIMSKDKLSILHQLIINNGPKTLSTGHVKYFSDSPLGDGYKKYESWLNSLCITNSHFDEIYKECVIPSPCWMISREYFDICGAFDSGIYPEDYDLCFRFYLQGMQVKSSSTTLHYWRDYDDRTSRTDDNYKDNRFLDLKTNYYLQIEYKKEKILYLWGAGKKAKRIAQILIANDIPFKWISNNTKKIGKDIYGQIIMDQSSIVDEIQIIIAIANPLEQKEIIQILKTKNNINYHFFS